MASGDRVQAQPQKCGTCEHRPSDLWECSHPACPNRKPVTAAAPEYLEEGRVPPRINDSH